MVRSTNYIAADHRRESNRSASIRVSAFFCDNGVNVYLSTTIRDILCDSRSAKYAFQLYDQVTGAKIGSGSATQSNGCGTSVTYRSPSGSATTTTAAATSS